MRKTELCLILIAALTLPTVAANHPQTQTVDGQTATVTFDHEGDNAYWVEVIVRSQQTVFGVLARVEGSTSWHSLRAMSGGDGFSKYGPRESFYIPPGKRVQFQAGVATSDGTTAVYSCYFTHPAGVEQCGGGASDPLRASFVSPSGNEWWQQVYVNANKNIQTVTLVIFDTDGTFGYPLTKRSWGAWAGSYYAPHGTLVRFSASDGLAQAMSGCYRWVDAKPMACPDSPILFNHKGGNEWWVEVDVGPLVPQRVQARDDGGEWKELTLRDWGHWAGSFRIEPGHSVEFRAFLHPPNDQWYTSCRFTHPAGVAPDQMRMCEGEL